MKLESLSATSVPGKEKCYICFRTASKDQKKNPSRVWVAHRVGSGDLKDFVHKKCLPLDRFQCSICNRNINPRSILPYSKRIRLFVSENPEKLIYTGKVLGFIFGIYLFAPTISDSAIRHLGVVHDYLLDVIHLNTFSQIAMRTYELGASVDASIKMIISSVALYHLGFFNMMNRRLGEEISRLRTLLEGGSPFLTKRAIQIGLVSPKQVISTSMFIGNMISFKLALEILLQKGITQNKLSEFLKEAIMYRKTEMIDFLLDKGANVNHSNENTWTPLITACAWRLPLEVIKKLIQKKADPTILSPDGRNVLHFICEDKNPDITILRYLLSIPNLKLNINAQDQEGKTPLFYLGADNLHVVRLLKTYGADITIPDANGATLLDKACINGNYAEIDYYKTSGLHFNLAKKLPFTFLSPFSVHAMPTSVFSAMKPKFLAKLIEEKLLDLYYVDPITGDSLLHLSLEHRELGLVIFLCEEIGKEIQFPNKNPLATLKNKDGKTVLQLLIEFIRSYEERNFRKEKEMIKEFCAIGFKIVESDVEAAKGDENLEKIVAQL